MSIVISACTHVGALDLGLGKERYLYAMENRFDLDVYIGSALIDMYAKCGILERPLLVFLKLRDKKPFCWNAAIKGLGVHGYANEAPTMFRKMDKEKIKPNGVTFESVLSACTHAGFVEEGRKRFSNMIQDYSIHPKVEHYGCMVDLLSKASLLENVLGLIRSMEFEPNSGIWGALLGGCELRKNLEIAQVYVKELMLLEPNNSGCFNLSVNMCVDVKRWGKVADIRATIKELGVEKGCPRSSWIETKRKVHQLAESDESHSTSDEIYSLLVELYVQLKLDVYVPQLDSEL